MSRRLPSGVRIFRPCLSITRADLRDYLAANGVPFREDPSNLDPRFTRNRLRHELLPLIQERFNPRAALALCRLAEQSQAAAQLIRRRAIRLLDATIIEKSDDHVRLQLEPFVKRHSLVVQEAAVVLWTRMRWPRVGMASFHWKRLAMLMKKRGPARLSLPGHVTAVRRRGQVSLERDVPRIDSSSRSIIGRF